MFRKIFVLIILVVVLSPMILAQSFNDYEIQQKYWYYRWRLRNDFVFVGNENGESLPLISRNQYDQENFGTGDITQMLAYYILTLATEYKLLNDQGRGYDLEMTKTELYYALKAFERLDARAEALYPYVSEVSLLKNPNDPSGPDVTVKEIEIGHYPPELDGYFMREDFPKDFFGDPFTNPCSEGGDFDPNNEHYVHFNNSLTNTYHKETHGVHNTTEAQLNYYIDSPFGECSGMYRTEWSTDDRATGEPNAVVPGKYVDMDEFMQSSPSIDQVANLLESFLVVKVSLPDQLISVSLTDGTSIQVNFVEEVRNYSERLINFIKFNENSTSGLTNRWKITTPNGETQIDEAHGGLFGSVSFPIAQIGNMIHDYNLFLPYTYIPTGFHDAESVAKRNIWNNAQLLPSLPYGENAWNTHSTVMHYATTSNSWLNIAGTGAPVYGSLFVVNKKRHTKNQVLNDSDGYGWDPYYAMLFGYLHGWDMNDENISNRSAQRADDIGIDLPSGDLDYVEFTKYQLSHMPCTHPHNFFPHQWPGLAVPSIVNGWNQAKRWDGPFYASIGENSDGDPIASEGGYFSGLDFMSLHNLYYLNSDDPLPKYVNYIYRYLDTDLPNIFPFNQIPLTFGAFVSITADNTVETDLDISYKASETITLKPGFHVESGASFHAYIEPVLCGQNFLKSNTPISDSISSIYGMSEITPLEKHAANSPKFDHLYEIPDTISLEDLKRFSEKMENSNFKNIYSEEFLRMQLATLEVSPNPVIDNIKTTCVGLNGSLTFQVLDANGKLCLEGNYLLNQSINVEDLPAGLYLIKVSEEEIYVTSKFIKK